MEEEGQAQSKFIGPHSYIFSREEKLQKNTTIRSENRAGAGFFCYGCGLNSGRSKWLQVVTNWATPTGMILAVEGAT